VTTKFAFNNIKNASIGYLLLIAWQGLNLELPGAEGLLNLITNATIKVYLKGIA
jgi:hypothetical protein